MGWGAVVDDLACQDFVEMVTDYLEGALPPHEVARIEAHLAECPGCAAYLEQIRLTIKALGRVSLDGVAEPERTSLLAAFRRHHAG